MGVILFVWKIVDWYNEYGIVKFEDVIVVYVGYVDNICKWF